MAPDESEPNVKKQIERKIYQLEKAKKDESRTKIREMKKSNALPPGQTRASSWLVLDIRPSQFQFDLDDSWRLEVVHRGKSQYFSLKDIKSRPDAVWISFDFHCVTSWSYCGLQVRGVPLKNLLSSIIHEKQTWSTMVQYGADYFSTSLPQDAVLLHDAYIIYEMLDPTTKEVLPLGIDHGGIRVLFPKLYGYKSAKWIVRLEFIPEVAKGFWEKLGYHEVGIAQLNQRFSNASIGTTAKSIMNPLNGWFSWYAINFPENFLAAQQCLSFDLRQSLFKWRFYWMVLTFWTIFPLYGLCYGGIALVRLVLKGQAIKYHAE